MITCPVCGVRHKPVASDPYCCPEHQRQATPRNGLRVRVVDMPDTPTPPRNLTHREHGKDNRE